MKLRSGSEVGSTDASVENQNSEGSKEEAANIQTHFLDESYESTSKHGAIQHQPTSKDPCGTFSRKSDVECLSNIFSGCNFLNKCGLLQGYVISSIKASAFVLVLMFVVCPTLLKYCPCIYNEVVFLQRLKWPPFKDVSSPSSCGTNHTRNLRLNSTDGVSLGAWHMLPAHFQNANLSSSDEYEAALQQDFPVLLYLHGNCGTRAGWHRVQLYKKLANMNFHVFAVDYRGFADSTGYPSEQGVVDDSLTAYRYIRSINQRVPVFIWGHSLGTAIATRLTQHLNQRGLSVESLILEAPFNNLVDAANVYPVTKLFSLLPWHAWAVEGLRNQGLQFISDQHIADVSVPTLILHAEDDMIVPYILGRKLYESALKNKKTGRVEFVTISGKHGYGHKHIHKHTDLENIIKKFIGWNQN